MLRKISTLPPRPVWLDAASLSKGINHDRQHLGIILAPGQTLTIRQINEAFTGNLSLWLMNDDVQTEAQFNVGSTWVEATVSAVSVPFIDTPYVEGEPIVEFQFPDKTKVLPVYRKGEREAAFFEQWDSQDAEFGLVDSEYFSMLVPKVSKEDLKALNINIDGLIAYYDRVFTFFNALAGVSFEAQNDSDLNVKNRYFIKADKNGIGAAYYSSTLTAESTPSVTSFYLTPEDTNWGCLHEIAHGYEGNFMWDKHFAPREVWNNIYCAIYQDIMLGDRQYEEGWLYRGGMPAVEKTIIDMIAESKPLTEWDYRSKLYFFMLMIFKAGSNTFTHFNQEYRKICNTPGFVYSEHVLMDMLSVSFAAAGAKVDVTPYIRLIDSFMTQEQQYRNAFSHAKAVYPLYQLVDAQNLESVKAQLKLKSSLWLVDTAQLMVTGIKGNVTLNFNIDNFAQIFGEDLILMEGARIAYKTQLNSPTMTLNDLPIGVYTLRLPTGRNRKYQLTPGYLVVKQGNNVVDVNFIEIKTSPILLQKIELQGLGNLVFGTIVIDHVKGIVVIDVINTAPHAYFAGELFAKITVFDQERAVIFNKEIYGTEVTLSHDEVPFVAGFTVEVHHEEPSRARLIPFYSNVFDNTNKTNVLLITKSGLKNVSLQGDPESALQQSIDTAAQELRSFKPAFYAPFSFFKDAIYLAICTIDSPTREKLLQTYKDVIPTDNARPGFNLGNAFTLTFKGNGDRQFMTGSVDLVKKTFTISTVAGNAHEYFTESYAYISYTNADGKTLYSHDVLGNQAQQDSTIELPISGYGGEVIHVRHEESDNRLTIINEMQHVPLVETGKQQTYRITRMGLERTADKQEKKN